MGEQDKKFWWTSDLHLGHRAILEYTDRASVCFDMDDHDQWVIDTLNQRVSKTDTLYIVGDVSFHNKWTTGALVEKIQGRKILIMGNHDHEKHAEFYKTSGLFAEVYEHRHMVKIDGVNIVMDHFPMIEWPKCQYGSWMLHGHTHGNSGLDRYNFDKFKIFDVGFDCMHYQYETTNTREQHGPVSFGYIRDLFEREGRESKDHHGKAD